MGIAGSFGLEVLEHSYCLANFYEDAKYASATSVFSTYINSHILLYALREMNVFSFKCAHFYQEYSNFKICLFFVVHVYFLHISTCISDKCTYFFRCVMCFIIFFLKMYEFVNFFPCAFFSCMNFVRILTKICVYVCICIFESMIRICTQGRKGF